MANFFKDYTKKSVEKLSLTEADKDLLKVKNEGSTHDPKTLPKPEKDEEWNTAFRDVRLNNRNKILGGSIMNRKVTAHIHSLDGKFAEVTILQYNWDNDIIVEYNGKKCTAIYNIFAGYYVDDIYGVIED